MPRYVLYLGGGCFAGVFGAGVVTALERYGFYGELDAVYGGSAGALNAAYFLTRQSQLGSKIYWEELHGSFQHPLNAVKGVIERLWSGHVRELSQESMSDVLDIDYLFDAALRGKPLDVAALSEQDTVFKAQVLDVEATAVTYLNVDEQPVKDVLRASVSALPYVAAGHKVNGKVYADPMVKDPAPVQRLLDEHPDKHIIVQLNHSKQRSWTHKVKDVTEGMIANQTHPGLYECFRERETRRREAMKTAEEHPRVTLITMPEEMSAAQFDQDPSELKRKHREGQAIGDTLLRQHSKGDLASH